MTKNFCDICGKEINASDIYNLRVNKAFGCPSASLAFEVSMICPACRKRLEDIIKNRKYWED